MSDELETVRDFFNYAVEAFDAAGLEFGHGAIDAVDEAAFIILEGLALPIDDINPWLDRKLSPGKCARLRALIRARIETRKPAAYLLNKAYIGGVPFFIDERVIVPRSFIGEILLEASPFLPPTDSVLSVLDLCTGSGCLAILAAMVFPRAKITACDLSSDALDVARINVEAHALVDRIDLAEGDLFEPVGRRKFDLIIANPPYVADAEVAAFSAEHRAEPVLAHHGGADGLEIVRRILLEAPRHLNQSGGLICEVGTGGGALEEAFPTLPFIWIDTADSEGELFFLSKEDFGRG